VQDHFGPVAMACVGELPAGAGRDAVGGDGTALPHLLYVPRPTHTMVIDAQSGNSLPRRDVGPISDGAIVIFDWDHSAETSWWFQDAARRLM